MINEKDLTERELLIYLAKHSLFTLDHSCCYGADETYFKLAEEGLEDTINIEFPGFLDKLCDYIVYGCILPKATYGSEFFAEIRMEGKKLAVQIYPSIYGACMEEYHPTGEESLIKRIKPVLPRINKIFGFKIDMSNFDYHINYNYSHGESSLEMNIATDEEPGEWKDYQELEGGEDILNIIENYLFKKVIPTYTYPEKVSIANNKILFYPEEQVNGEEIKILLTPEELIRGRIKG
jgi:hypothetical protein